MAAARGKRGPEFDSRWRDPQFRQCGRAGCADDGVLADLAWGEAHKNVAGRFAYRACSSSENFDNSSFFFLLPSFFFLLSSFFFLLSSFSLSSFFFLVSCFLFLLSSFFISSFLWFNLVGRWFDFDVECCVGQSQSSLRSKLWCLGWQLSWRCCWKVIFIWIFFC